MKIESTPGGWRSCAPNLTHAEKRAELRKWLAVCRDRREKMIALRIFKKRTMSTHITFVLQPFKFSELGRVKDIIERYYMEKAQQADVVDAEITHEEVEDGRKGNKE